MAVHAVHDTAHTAAPPRVRAQRVALLHVSVEVLGMGLHLITHW